MKQLKSGFSLCQCGQRIYHQIIQSARALAAAHDEQNRTVGLKPELRAARGSVARLELRSNRRASAADVRGVQPNARLRKTDEGLVHDPRKPARRAARNRVRFVQKCSRAKPL